MAEMEVSSLYFSRDLHSRFFTGLGQLGNIYGNFGGIHKEQMEQPEATDDPRITDLIPARTIYSEKKKQHKHKLLGPNFLRTFLPAWPGVKKFLPTTGAA